MASVIIHYSGQYIRNSTGGTASGALLYVYDAQTLDLATIYSDADVETTAANPITADSAGLLPIRYKSTGDYKVILKTSGGTTLDEEDNIPGAVATASGTAEYARPDTPVVVKTADYVTLTTDLGSVINCTVTGGTIQITLLSAVTAGDGGEITIRHTGTANFVKIVTSSAQTITHPAVGTTTTAFSLVGYGESATFVSDGANWHVKGYVPPLMTPNTPGVIKVADRLSAPPASPDPGARYILTSSPSGAWSTYAEHDIAEANGQSSGWIKYTPPTDCGWVAYVQDEDDYYIFKASAWVTLGAALLAVADNVATQAEMETATSVAKIVTPGRQHFHPGMAKTWGYATVSGGTPTLQTSYNMTSITDAGTGEITFTIATDFSTANWASPAGSGNASEGRAATVTAKAAGTVSLLNKTSGEGAVDPTEWTLVGFGDHV